VELFPGSQLFHAPRQLLFYFSLNSEIGNKNIAASSKKNSPRRAGECALRRAPKGAVKL
jgi:hypothetical protein